jgi:hypothetical protein
MHLTTPLLLTSPFLFPSLTTAWKATFYPSKDCSGDPTELSGGAGPANGCHEDPAYYCTDIGITAKSLKLDFQDEVDGELKSVNGVFGWNSMDDCRPGDDGYWPYGADANLNGYGYELEHGRCVSIDGPCEL